MGIKVRNYTKKPGFTKDFFKVRDFLIRIHESGYRDENWLWARWEYMFSHPYLDESKLSHIGIWEDKGKIVALANFEFKLGEAFFSYDSEYFYLKEDMFEYAVKKLSNVDDKGHRTLQLMINDSDEEFKQIASAHGYIPTDDLDVTSEYVKNDSFPLITLPEGFKVTSLDEENDLFKINRVLWRGFNHPGEAPEDDLSGRIRMQSGPDFKKELTIAIKAPNGEFVSFCGMWYYKNTDYAMVEPVATDPDYRRMGLGKAAVLEGVRRCFDLGATVAYVGSGQQFYKSIGFKPVFTSRWWRKAE